ncbi:MAG: MBL fold metallo-hydrolase [Chloroflexi bacterium]|nr:MBL fold metallo-hydrolase [Chloroflexota bacterium]
MEILFLGHSAFRLRGRDVTVVTDPYPPQIGFSMGKVSANIVTVSHESPNHSFVGGVQGNPRVVAGPGEYEIADVLIAGVATAQEPRKGALNTAYVLRFDDLAACHLGDLRSKLANQQLEELGDIDVLFIPVGGGNALDPTAAAEVVSQIDPRIVVPMHYHMDGGRVEGLESVEGFVREMGSKDIVPEPKLSVTRSSLPPEVRVVVLENRRV